VSGTSCRTVLARIVCHVNNDASIVKWSPKPWISQESQKSQEICNDNPRPGGLVTFGDHVMRFLQLQLLHNSEDPQDSSVSS
jgi:hypothetical protein